MNKLIVVFGPTSSGKTDLSLQLAKYIYGKYSIESEIVGTDSRQLYQGMDIGTAKISKETRTKYIHYFIDRFPPTERYTSEQFTADVKSVLKQITAKGYVAILVGGSGTFVMGVIGDKHLINGNGKELPYQTLVLIPYFERPVLYRKIEQSIEEMFQLGLYTELKRLISQHKSIPWQLKVTHGYREFIEYAAKNHKDIMRLNSADLGKIKWQIKVHTKKYAMHQSGWLKKMKDYHIVKNVSEAKVLVDQFMKN